MSIHISPTPPGFRLLPAPGHPRRDLLPRPHHIINTRPPIISRHHQPKSLVPHIRVTGIERPGNEISQLLLIPGRIPSMFTQCGIDVGLFHRGPPIRLGLHPPQIIPVNGRRPPSGPLRKRLPAD
ncbi:hypothetical protein ACEE18_10360, partial [Corynebacterium freneyi]